MKNTSFEDYLQDVFMEENPQTLDDDISDEFDNWLADLDVAQMLEYGEELFAKMAEK